MSLEPIFADARVRLRAAPREGLGELVVPRRILGIARAARIEPRGLAWHLGALLLTEDAVLSTGRIVRARAEVRRGYAAQSQRERAELAAAARRGGFAEGQTVHVEWQVLDLAAVALGATSGPLAVRGGVPSIHWSTAGGWMPLADYLGERIALIENPLPGAS